MKKIFIISVASCIFFLTAYFLLNKKQENKINNEVNVVIEEEDFFEKNFPVKKVISPQFINDLAYNKDENFLKHAFYHKFGIYNCYVHEDIYPNMMKLANILKERNLKALIFDCFRPQEVQMYVWNLHPNPKYLANPHKKGSMHSRGLAVDLALADMDGNELKFANVTDHFVASSSHNYKCKKGEEEICENRKFFKSIMEEAGLRSIKNEWWHYQRRGTTENYPLISICNTSGATCPKE